MPPPCCLCPSLYQARMMGERLLESEGLAGGASGGMEWSRESRVGEVDEREERPMRKLTRRRLSGQDR